MEMRYYCKILRILCKDDVTNEEVHAKIQQAIGPHEDLLTTVKRSKLQWYGHVSRSSGLAKTILQGTVKGGRRQGRRRKRWEDNIRKWTGLEFAKSQTCLFAHLICSEISRAPLAQVVQSILFLQPLLIFFIFHAVVVVTCSRYRTLA